MYIYAARGSVCVYTYITGCHIGQTHALHISCHSYDFQGMSSALAQSYTCPDNKALYMPACVIVCD